MGSLLDLGSLSANDWSTAASPKLLELLRRRVAAVLAEADSVRAEVTKNKTFCKDCALQIEANRRRVRDLVDAGASAAPTEPLPVGVEEAAAHSGIARVAALHAETDTLASEVSEAAALQVKRCQSLRGLQAAARLARLKRGARAAMDSRRRLGVEYDECKTEIGVAAEATAALRLRARCLREEVAAADGEALALGASSRLTVVPDEMTAALRLELASEERRCRSAFLADCTQEEAEAALRRQAAGLTLRIASTEANCHRLTDSLEDSERHGAAIASELHDALGRTLSLTKTADAHDSVCQLLEAELRQQRDATTAWWACADDPEDPQDISFGVTGAGAQLRGPGGSACGGNYSWKGMQEPVIMHTP